MIHIKALVELGLCQLKQHWARTIHAAHASSRKSDLWCWSLARTGSPETVHRELASLIERYRPEEVMVTGMIHNHAARLRSFVIAADVLSDISEAYEAA